MPPDASAFSLRLNERDHMSQRTFDELGPLGRAARTYAAVMDVTLDEGYALLIRAVLAYGPKGRTTMGTMYISGPIRGHADRNRPLFDKGAEFARLYGWDPVLPHDNEHDHDPSRPCTGAFVEEGNPHRYGCYLRADFASLLGADAILLLPGWPLSYGASLERQLAAWIGLETWVLESSPGVVNSYTIRPIRDPAEDAQTLDTAKARERQEAINERWRLEEPRVGSDPPVVVAHEAGLPRRRSGRILNTFPPDEWPDSSGLHKQNPIQVHLEAEGVPPETMRTMTGLTETELETIRNRMREEL